MPDTPATDPTHTVPEQAIEDRSTLRDRIAEELAARFTADGNITQGMRVIDPDDEDDPKSARRVLPIEAADAVLAVADAEQAELKRALMQAQAQAYQYRTALQGAARRAAVLSAVGRPDLHNVIADVVTPFLANFSDEEAARINAQEVAHALLRRLAAEQPTNTEAHPPSHTWKVESPRRDTWASWGATYDDREWAQERYESATSTARQRPFRLVRATTTYTVEAEHTPAEERPVVVEQPDTQTREADLTERLERGRAQLLEAMSGVSEERTCAGWCGDWARTLHAEGGIWETLGRTVGWPTGNYDQWVWVSWDEAAALYAAEAAS